MRVLQPTLAAFTARALIGNLCMSSAPPPSSLQRSAPSQKPLFTFGVIADVQWADTEDGWNYVKTVSRKYRGAFRTLQRAVTWWNALPQPPKFIAQLGDLLDGINVELGQSNEALEAALDELQLPPEFGEPRIGPVFAASTRCTTSIPRLHKFAGQADLGGQLIGAA